MLLLAAALLAVAPAASLSEAQLSERIAKVHAAPMGERIAELSSLFVGAPYTEFPLGEGGEGPEPQARWRTDGVDCQTLIETVLAMANATSVPEAKRVLDDLRYGGDTISFATRNHFTEAQWLPANTQKGYLRDEVPSLDGHAPKTELVLHRAQWEKNPGLKRLLPANIPDGKFPIRYLDIAQIQRHAASIEPGSVILVVREHDSKRVVRVSHMGFVLKGPQGLFVRHASTGEKRVTDEPFDQYVARNASFKSWKVAGFGLYMPVDAKARAAKVTER